MKILLILAVFAAPLRLAAQGFITPVEEFPPARECFVVLEDGSRIDGKIKSVTAGNGIKSLKMVDDNGTELKFSVDEIRQLNVKATGLVKMELMAESTETIKKFTKADWKEIRAREYIVFEKVHMPGKKEKFALVQLLNPDFDSVIKVYQDPWAQETGEFSVGIVQISGAEDRSYLYVKNNEQAFKVKKGSYRKNFMEIFGDCPDMIKAYAGERLKFKNAPEHVWVYQFGCPGHDAGS